MAPIESAQTCTPGKSEADFEHKTWGATPCHMPLDQLQVGYPNQIGLNLNALVKKKKFSSRSNGFRRYRSVMRIGLI